MAKKISEDKAFLEIIEKEDIGPKISLKKIKKHLSKITSNPQS